MSEPINEQALTKIRELLADDGREWNQLAGHELYRMAASAGFLLTEVDRLRAREQALEAENAAMRPMVEALSCLNEAGSRIEPAAVYYALEVEPLIEEAQQFVAAHPTSTAAAENETESAGGDDEHPGHD